MIPVRISKYTGNPLRSGEIPVVYRIHVGHNRENESNPNIADDRWSPDEIASDSRMRNGTVEWVTPIFYVE